MVADPPALLRHLFAVSVGSAAPDRVVPPHLPEPPPGRTLVVGAGKAAAAMAAAVEAHWTGDLFGLVVTRHGHAVPTRAIRVVEAGHPLPDDAGTVAAREILTLAQGLGPDDLLLCLISGGGSALLALPPPLLTLDDKRRVTAELLRCGATIAEINTVRRHLSAIKGGRLAAAAWPAKCVTLAISDVPGDDPATIASGPTVPDPTTADAALAVLRRHGIDLPAAVLDHLCRPDAESPKPGDPRLTRATFRIVADPARGQEAAAEAARAAGLTPVLLGAHLEGEARTLGRAHAALARRTPPGTVVLSGGETTVNVHGPGRGGRNTEYLLAFALATEGAANLWALAADTDGIDGTGENAGALHRPDGVLRARAASIDPDTCLARNDSYGYFACLGDLVVTGPTRTNINDFRAILVM